MSRSSRFVLALSIAAFAGTQWTASSLLADQPNTPAQQVNTPQPLQWIGDYGLALAVCRANTKPLLVVMEKPDAPPFKMLPTTLITAEANERMLAKYTLCRVDVTTDYGRQVAECFKAQEFPYTAIIDKTGAHVLYRKAGEFDTRGWVTTLVEYESGERKQLDDEFCFT